VGLDERRELDHRMANSLQLAADFLIFEFARISDPAARDALMTASARLSAVGQLHRFLSGHESRGPLDLEAYLAELGELVADSTGLSCTIEADPCRLPGGPAQLLAIAVNELAMNAAKHAYPAGAGGPLRVECRCGDGRLRLTVADRGRGLPEGFDVERSKGLGMTIVGAVVRQLGGVLTAASDGGAQFTLDIPAPRTVAAGPRSFAPPQR
jgi:two-component sensor histidine kinase